MRLHLIIQRHGLPVTRILWTTSPPSLFGENASGSSSYVTAPSSAITSTRAPNALYSTGGYTIAQLLEDVNEVVPLETEPALFDKEYSGQWGLEDYVVEVGGSECLHFMEVGGLLRDGDEVLIRALQICDLRARRLSGRHQISGDGRHLIDGVPFGKPYIKRPTSSRPAITIPPRKKRRTTLAAWDNTLGYEEEDTEWAPPGRVHSLRELSDLRRGDDEQHDEEKADEGEYEHAYQDDYEDYHQNHEDTGEGTVIRYNVDGTEDVQGSDSDADISDFDDEDLSEELKGLKEDLDISAVPEIERTGDEQPESGEPRRTRSSLPPTEPIQRSLAQPANKAPSDAGSSRRDSKAVRFEGQKEVSPAPTPSPAPAPRDSPAPRESPVSKAESKLEDNAASDSPGISSISSSSLSSDTSSDEDSLAASGNSTSESESGSDSDSSDSDSSSGSDSSSDSDSVSSDSEDEEIPDTVANIVNPPGFGSIRTKKSNQRGKRRRRLLKLKELGALPANADFSDLQVWEQKNGNTFYIAETTSSTKEKEQAEFEAKRQKLLRDLASGHGVDVSAHSEKENLPPKQSKETAEDKPEEDHPASVDSAKAKDSEPKRRTLDLVSSRRMLFGSLGVRTPRTKEDEEATRKKFADKANKFVPQNSTTEEVADVPESDSDENWQEKLIIRATECIHDDIELTSPPFPFEQRWDVSANNAIRKRKGLGKKRKRKQQLQSYDGEGEEEYYNYDEYYGEDNYAEDNYAEVSFNYDDWGQEDYDMENSIMPIVEGGFDDTDDLPLVPSDSSALRDLVEGELKGGSVIAFKQLDMSKETNWQPIVSEYRVAKIHDIFDNNILKIQLAMRDRRPTKEEPEHEVDEGGRPMYSGFEMPGFDDDEGEDDGFREVSFADFIDPKLLRDATTTAKNLGGAEEAIISADSSQRNSKPVTIEVERTPDDDQQQLALKSEQPTAKAVDGVEEAPAGNSSVGIKSPEFYGFQSERELSPATSEREALNSEPNPVASHDSANDIKSQEKDAPSTPSFPPNQLKDEIPGLEFDNDDNLQLIKTPENAKKFNHMLDSILDERRSVKKEPKASSPSKDIKEPEQPLSQESSSSVVPNPFYEIDKAHEERRQRNSKKSNSLRDGDTTEYLSAVEFNSSPPSHKSPVVVKPEPSPSQDVSLISEIPETIEKVYDSQPPPSSQVSDVIDLTQSSPPVSPGGSDKDFAKSHRLPRGPGWVHKNMRNPRRQTRLSSSAPQSQKSISPPPTKRNRRYRG